MKKLSKRFVERAIVSRTDPFRSARWKLTVLYWVIIAAIVAVLSASLYEFHSHDVDQLRRRGPSPAIMVPASPADTENGPTEETGALKRGTSRRSTDAGIAEKPELAEYFERLGRNIILADLVTLIIGGALSALLAGRTLRPIRAAVESEKKFYANVAHDLRTPLAVMRSEAEVALRSSELTEQETRRLVKSSLEEIDHMSVMVEQMLDLARGPGGKGRGRNGLVFARVDLAALVRSIVEKNIPRAADRGMRLTHRVVPATIRGEEHSLQRAIDNLVENALAYTPSGGSVEVAVEKAHGQVVLRVEDTGIGIPDADLPHITEPFFRGDRARGTHPGGAGLGLTIVKDTVDAHGGTLRVARGPIAGTVIALRFPAG
jgi:signal transduction histidine kinase